MFPIVNNTKRLTILKWERVLSYQVSCRRFRARADSGNRIPLYLCLGRGRCGSMDPIP